MAQYWLEIASAADLAQLEVVTTGTLSYTTDGGIPVAAFSSTTAVGEYVRLVGVPSVSTMVVQALFRQVAGSFSGGRTGPAARINAGNGYIFGKNTSTTYRASKSVSGTWSEIGINATGQPAGGAWSWLEIAVAGTDIEFRAWVEGGERPESTTSAATDASLSSGVAGFGAPGAGTATAHIRIISVGTNGDPAPTGPVGGRQRSRLILTPW